MWYLDWHQLVFVVLREGRSCALSQQIVIVQENAYIVEHLAISWKTVPIWRDWPRQTLRAERAVGNWSPLSPRGQWIKASWQLLCYLRYFFGVTDRLLSLHDGGPSRVKGMTAPGLNSCWVGWEVSSSLDSARTWLWQQIGDTESLVLCIVDVKARRAPETHLVLGIILELCRCRLGSPSGVQMEGQNWMKMNSLQ